MAELLDILRSHVSVRQFTGEPISEAVERDIVATAQHSPTSSNLQTYTIIGIREQSTKDKMAELCGKQSHISKSSLFLVFCADLYRLSRLNGSKGYRFNGDYTELFILATVDATLAASRALIAAQALGVGGVMVGGVRNDPAEVGFLLNLPKLTYAVMGMSLGYPASRSEPKPRLPIEGVYCKEKYSDLGFDAAVREYDNMIEDFGHLTGREINPEDYPGFKGQYVWSEHSARRVADTSTSTLRPHMKSYLQSQGLLLK